MTDPAHRQPPTLQRLVDMFRSAMTRLGKSPSDMDLEAWAVLIHSSMSGRGRSYHTVDHVFHVNGDTDAIGSLAILFHDTVYCEVDGGIPSGLEKHLGDALLGAGKHTELGAFDPEVDELRALVARVFGFTPGQAVTFQQGLNELASALLAVRTLQSHLSMSELAQVVTCIEATIPFRPQSAEDVLAARLAEADRVHHLGLGETGVQLAVQRAVGVANSDVGNFAYEDTAAFLSHTWEILPETNPQLRLPAYTLGEYRLAMTKMAGFLAMLDAGKVFRQFRGAPTDAALSELRSRAATNIERGERYLRLKLLSARLLETLATLTGGDAPVSLMMGDLPHESDGLRLEQILPAIDRPLPPDIDPEVFRLLRDGRTKDSGFDLRHSPLASHLYAQLGDAASERALAAGDGWPLLDALPRAMVIEVAKGCAQVATTRAARLYELVRHIEARG